MDLLKDIALPTAALTIGAIAIIVAILGNIETEKFHILLPLKKSILLAIFGVILLFIGVIGYFAPMGLLIPSNMPIVTETMVSKIAPTLTPTSSKIATLSPSPTSQIVTLTPRGEIFDPEGIAMVLIPSGKFIMGRTDADEGNEKPAHEVFLRDYYIDKYEVTNEAYEACEAVGVCKPPSKLGSEARGGYYNDFDYRNFPVIYVDWEMANAYCEWRGARLPTEAEWEKAARGEDPDNKFYPWGRDTGCKFGNFAVCNNDTTEVGSYPESKGSYGVYDMAGNVWEWVADWYGYDYYDLSPYNNPQGPSSGTHRVIRGGSWNNPSDQVRVTYRARFYPFIKSFNLGFRCAKSITKPSVATETIDLIVTPTIVSSQIPVLTPTTTTTVTPIPDRLINSNTAPIFAAIITAIAAILVAAITGIVNILVAKKKST